METGNTSVLLLLEQLVHSFLKRWKNRSEEEEVLHQRWGKSIGKETMNTTNSQTLLLFTHKVLLDINTNIFVTTSMKNTAGVPTVRAATVQTRTGAFHLVTWAGEFHVRQEVTSVFLLLLRWRSAVSGISWAGSHFNRLFPFCWFVWHQKYPPRDVPAAVKPEVAPLSSSSRRRGNSDVLKDPRAPWESVLFCYVSV